MAHSAFIRRCIAIAVAIGLLTVCALLAMSDAERASLAGLFSWPW